MAKLMMLDPKLLDPTPDNPRHVDTDCAAFRELATSVGASGVTVPVAVRPKADGRYDLRYGARRLAATLATGRTEIPALVYEGLSDEEAFALTFGENYCRQELTVLEQGRAVEVLLEKCGGDVDAVAARLGETPRWVRLRERLTKLSDGWRAELDHGAESSFAQWGVGHLVLIARYPADVQDQLLKGLDGKWQAEEMTVAELSDWLNDRYQRVLAKAVWALDDAALLKDAPACLDCPKRSSCQGVLFDEGGRADDRCLDPECWERKSDAWLPARRKELAAELGRPVAAVYPAKIENVTWREVDRIKKALKTEPLNKASGEYEPSKKSDAAAVPAMVAYGAKAGTVKWVKPKIELNDKANRVPRPKPSYTSGSSKPKTLKELRERLELKRVWALCDRVGKEIAEPIDPPSDVVLVALSAAFLNSRFDDDRTVDEVMAEFAEVQDVGIEAFCRARWKSMCEVMEAWMGDVPVWGDAQENIREYTAAAKRLCEVFGLPFDEFQALAVAEHPEPPEWADLKADGTPKKKAKKGGK